MSTSGSGSLSLPFDIIFETLRYLSPADITCLGATCRNLHAHTASPQIWAEQGSHLRTEFPREKTPAHRISPVELRKKVILEAQVDKQWRGTSSKPVKTTKIGLNYSCDVSILDVLPGGEHLLVVLADGAVDVLSVSESETALSETRTKLLHDSFHCSGTGTNVTVDDHYWIMTSGTTGFLLLQLYHPRLPGSDPNDHIHYRIYVLDLDAGPLSGWLPLLGDFQLSSLQCAHNWRRFGENIYYVYHFFGNFQDPWLRVALVKSSALSSGGTTLPARHFKLTGSQYISPSEPYLCDFNMISSRRLIVSGLGQAISIYDLPPHLPPPDSAAIDISPIWTWKDATPPPPHYLACSPVTFNSRCNDAICWIIDRSMVFHRFLLSSSGDPVKQHERFQNEVPSPFAIGNIRGMSCTAKDGVVTAETVTVSDRVDRGSIEIPLAEGLRYCEERTFSFEESTGRMSLAVQDGEGRLYVLVVDVV